MGGVLRFNGVVSPSGPGRYRISVWYKSPEARTTSVRINSDTPFAKTQAVGYYNTTVGNASVRQMVMTCWPNLNTVYSAEQQIEDFGSVQSQVRMQLAQLSALVGLGHPLDVTL